MEKITSSINEIKNKELGVGARTIFRTSKYGKMTEGYLGDDVKNAMCGSFKSFVDMYGDLVYVDDGKLKSLWWDDNSDFFILEDVALSGEITGVFQWDHTCQEVSGYNLEVLRNDRSSNRSVIETGVRMLFSDSFFVLSAGTLANRIADGDISMFEKLSVSLAKWTEAKSIHNSFVLAETIAGTLPTRTLKHFIDTVMGTRGPLETLPTKAIFSDENMLGQITRVGLTGNQIGSQLWGSSGSMSNGMATAILKKTLAYEYARSSTVEVKAEDLPAVFIERKVLDVKLTTPKPVNCVVLTRLKWAYNYGEQKEPSAYVYTDYSTDELHYLPRVQHNESAVVKGIYSTVNWSGGGDQVKAERLFIETDSCQVSPTEPGLTTKAYGLKDEYVSMKEWICENTTFECRDYMPSGHFPFSKVEENTTVNEFTLEVTYVEDDVMKELTVVVTP